MSDPHVNATLNEVLITLCRSLLQYVGESWPWSGPDASKKWIELEKLINAQRRDVQAIANLLDERNHSIDWSQYPDYSDLNYLSLDYFLRMLEENMRSVIGQIELALSQCKFDSDAATLLESVLKNSRDHLAAIQKLMHVSKPTVSPIG